MYMRLYIIVEGQTEESFVNQTLKPYLGNFLVGANALVVTTSRKRGARGGLSDYHKPRNDILRLTKQEKNANVRFTTMFDLYGLPIDFPATPPPHRPIPLSACMRWKTPSQTTFPILASSPTFSCTNSRHCYSPILENLNRSLTALLTQSRDSQQWLRVSLRPNISTTAAQPRHPNASSARYRSTKAGRHPPDPSWPKRSGWPRYAQNAPISQSGLANWKAWESNAELTALRNAKRVIPSRASQCPLLGTERPPGLSRLHAGETPALPIPRILPSRKSRFRQRPHCVFRIARRAPRNTQCRPPPPSRPIAPLRGPIPPSADRH